MDFWQRERNEFINLANKLGNGDISYESFSIDLQNLIDFASYEALSWLATQIAKVGP